MQSPSLHVENIVIQGFRIENCAQKMDVKVHLFFIVWKKNPYINLQRSPKEGWNWQLTSLGKEEE
jgi:hypothetical protein